MKVLLDHNLPRQRKPLLIHHEIYTAREMRWDFLKNGALLASAELEGCGAIVTGDQNLSYQQNERIRSISLIVLTEIDRRVLVGQEALILGAIARAAPGSFELVHILGTPAKPRR